VAGKEFAGGKTGAWIRPVDPKNDNAISEQESLYKDGASADLLDIVTIPMTEPKPQHYHTENHQIDPGFYWAKHGRATSDQIVAATDNVAGALWLDGESSFHGANDKVAEASANGLPNSLLLIKPSRLSLVVAEESQYGGGSKRKVRADFTLNGVNYNFVVTDPWIETKYFAKADGTYPLNDARLCVSLAEASNGLAIKLVAAVITPDRIG
jgi:hypothetical protein